MLGEESLHLCLSFEEYSACIFSFDCDAEYALLTTATEPNKGLPLSGRARPFYDYPE
jgi:hypothetical protein